MVTPPPTVAELLARIAAADLDLELLKRQNALLLKRLLTVSRERDELAKKLAALRPVAEEAR